MGFAFFSSHLSEKKPTHIKKVELNECDWKILPAHSYILSTQFNVLKIFHNEETIMENTFCVQNFRMTKRSKMKPRYLDTIEICHTIQIHTLDMVDKIKSFCISLRNRNWSFNVCAHFECKMIQLVSAWIRMVLSVDAVSIFSCKPLNRFNVSFIRHRATNGPPSKWTNVQIFTMLSNSKWINNERIAMHVLWHITKPKWIHIT